MSDSASNSSSANVIVSHLLQPCRLPQFLRNNYISSSRGRSLRNALLHLERGLQSQTHVVVTMRRRGVVDRFPSDAGSAGPSEEPSVSQGITENAQDEMKPTQKGTDADMPSPANAFECNICFDIPRDPVVTRCGHLYCWSCLYRVSNSAPWLD